MRPRLLARFGTVFFKRLGLKELSVHLFLAVAGIVYIFVSAHRSSEAWDVAVPLVWTLAAMVAWHAYATAVRLIREITDEQRMGPTQRESTILRESGFPILVPVPPSTVPLYRVKITSIAVVLCALALLTGYVTWRLGRNSEVEPKKIQPAITWFPKPLTAGDKLSAEQLNAQANGNGKTIDGQFIYNPTFGTTLPAGTQTLDVKFTPDDQSAFLSGEKTVTIIVNPSFTPPTTKTAKKPSGPVPSKSVIALPVDPSGPRLCISGRL